MKAMISIEYKKVLPEIEVIERKEFGHPDTISDYLAEEASIFLSKQYLKDYGYILHHNVDKALLVGGETEVDFGTGKMLKPIKFYLAGRAQKIEDYQDELIEYLYEKLFEILPHIKREQFQILLDIRKGSEALIGTVEQKVPLANDTSFGVGFYPWTEAENTTYQIARFLYENSLKDNRFGQDIKVMMFNDGIKKEVTIAQAFISLNINSWEEYQELKDRTIQEITDRFGVVPKINTADNSGPYLTLTGTSAEAGDDGQVGRGNRINGLITPMRKMTLEAAAGKNPWSHVGKTYQLLSQLIAKDIFNELGIANEVVLVSKIGQPVTNPKAIYIALEKEADKGKIEEIVKKHLESAPKLYERLLTREFKVVV